MIERERIRFDEIPITESLMLKDETLNKSLFVEEYVREWLNRCNFLQKIRTAEPNKKRLYLEENEGGSIHVRKGEGILKFEFDDLICHDGINYVVEVKSQNLNGYKKKMPFVLEASKQLFGNNSGGILLFMPLYRNPSKQETINSIKEEFNGDVNFVDLRYTKKDFKVFFQKKGYIVR
ncbi:MAG: hypothetical protein PF569_02750 [Candidatus Woesearchaeota archaeon]|nr:hypothetical protein [Candidatus Woesearchaeota archaeon]